MSPSEDSVLGHHALDNLSVLRSEVLSVFLFTHTGFAVPTDGETIKFPLSRSSIGYGRLAERSSIGYGRLAERSSIGFGRLAERGGGLQRAFCKLSRHSWSSRVDRV